MKTMTKLRFSFSLQFIVGWKVASAMILRFLNLNMLSVCCLQTMRQIFQIFIEQQFYPLSCVGMKRDPSCDGTRI
jgi:hypothetical protein